MSDRNLAEVVAYYTGKDYSLVLNDVYSVKSTESELEAVAKVRRRLLPCDYEDWLEEG